MTSQPINITINLITSGAAPITQTMPVTVSKKEKKSKPTRFEKKDSRRGLRFSKGRRFEDSTSRIDAILTKFGITNETEQQFLKKKIIKLTSEGFHGWKRIIRSLVKFDGKLGKARKFLCGDRDLKEEDTKEHGKHWKKFSRRNCKKSGGKWLRHRGSKVWKNTRFSDDTSSSGSSDEDTAKDVKNLSPEPKVAVADSITTPPSGVQPATESATVAPIVDGTATTEPVKPKEKPSKSEKKLLILQAIFERESHLDESTRKDYLEKAKKLFEEGFEWPRKVARMLICLEGNVEAVRKLLEQKRSKFGRKREGKGFSKFEELEKKYGAQANLMEDMGYKQRRRNLKLLASNDGDLAAVCARLVKRKHKFEKS